MLFVIFIIGVFVARPKHINEAIALRRYVVFELQEMSENASSVIKQDKALRHDSAYDYLTHTNKRSDYNHNISTHVRIGIIVTNLGLNKRSTELALTLPSFIALGFSPYINNLRPLLYQASRNGHEIYINVPMNTGDHGKYELMSTLDVSENASRLDNILDTYTACNGVYTNYASEFADNRETIKAMLLNKLQEKKMILILRNDIKAFVPEYLTTNHRVIMTSVTINQTDEEEIKHGLSHLIEYAKEQGKAIGYVQGYAITMRLLQNLISTLESHGIELVPISQLLAE